MSPRDPVPGFKCVTDDPEMQGWTEKVSFDLKITWPDPSDADEPYITIGKPWYVLEFDGPRPWKSGASYVFSTCHRPGDSMKAKVQIAVDRGMDTNIWFFD